MHKWPSQVREGLLRLADLTEIGKKVMMVAIITGFFYLSNQILKRMWTSSPSCTSYSLPSKRKVPCLRASAIEPAAMRSS